MSYELQVSTPERSVRVARPGYPLHLPDRSDNRHLARALESYLLAGYTPEEIVDACNRLKKEG